MGLVAPWHVGSSWTRDHTRLLHWQADSLPLSHQGSPPYKLLFNLFHSTSEFIVHYILWAVRKQKRYLLQLWSHTMPKHLWTLLILNLVLPPWCPTSLLLSPLPWLRITGVVWSESGTWTNEKGWGGKGNLSHELWETALDTSAYSVGRWSYSGNRMNALAVSLC